MRTGLTLALVLGSIYCLAQSQTASEMPKSSIHFEALGSGLTYSVSTERFLYREPRFAIGLRAGGSFMPAKISRWPGSVVVGVTALWGNAPEYLELGAYNVVLIDKRSSRPLSLANFTIGYRHQPKVKGILLRLAFTPFFTRIVDLEKRSFPLLPYAGFSVGYGF